MHWIFDTLGESIRVPFSLGRCCPSIFFANGFQRKYAIPSTYPPRGNVFHQGFQKRVAAVVKQLFQSIDPALAAILISPFFCLYLFPPFFFVRSLDKKPLKGPFVGPRAPPYPAQQLAGSRQQPFPQPHGPPFPQSPLGGNLKGVDRRGGGKRVSQQPFFPPEIGPLRLFGLAQGEGVLQPFAAADRPLGGRVVKARLKDSRSNERLSPASRG